MSIIRDATAGQAQRFEAASRPVAPLVNYVKAKLAGVLEVNGNIEPMTAEIPYGIPARLAGTGRLQDHALESAATYLFEYDDAQLSARNDYFRRLWH